MKQCYLIGDLLELVDHSELGGGAGMQLEGGGGQCHVAHVHTVIPAIGQAGTLVTYLLLVKFVSVLIIRQTRKLLIEVIFKQTLIY